MPFKSMEFNCSNCGRYCFSSRKKSENNFCGTNCYFKFRIGKNKGGNLEERFWRRVTKTDTCWNWNGGTCSDGYGSIGNFKTILSTHRLSYEIAYGKIPKGLSVCHKCDNRLCVKPDHLFLGTHLDNIRDCAKKKRTWDRSGENNPNTKLSISQINEIKRLFDGGYLTRQEIAKKFGISWSTAHRIARRIHWSKTQL